MSRRILVMRSGALGDFILGLPALRALREAFPDHQLEVVGPGALLPLASSLVDLSTPIERAEMAAFFGETELPREMAERYAGLDLAVLWLADREGLVRGHFGRLGTRQILHAPALPPADQRIHATDYLLETLRPLGILPSRVAVKGDPVGLRGDPDSTERRAVPSVRPDPAAVNEARSLFGRLGLALEKPVVAIHPGSGGRWKCWPAERFARVADLLADVGHQVVLVQGPADEEVVGQVLAAVEGEPLPVISDLSTEDLVAVLSICTVYLGNDSGVTHLAAATGVPTVALFGPTDPAIWGPRGRAVAIVRGDQGLLEAITVERAVKTVMRSLRAG